MRGPALEQWRDRHAGETMLVCGCGHSLAALTTKPPCQVIGVNDVGRQFDPDYLVVVNPRQQFLPERFTAVEHSRARAVFTSVANLGIPHPCVVRFQLGRRGGTAVEALNQVPYTRNSPYVALALALFMGARRIGLIGVDFTQNHFYGATRTHSLARELEQTDREYGRFARDAAVKGVEIENLSAESRLTTLARVTLHDFLASLQRPRRRVLHIASTNCAGAIWKLHRLMQADGRFESRVATASSMTCGVNRHPRQYPQDISWQDMATMRSAIERADILHFHNFVDAQSPGLARYSDLMRKKPAVLQVHTEPELLAPHFPDRDPRTRTDIPVLVIAQKHARFYPRATPVMNALMPADFANASGAAHPAPGPPRVVFTPTDLADYPPAPPTCRGKGYQHTRALLDRLGKAGLIEPVIGIDIDYDRAMALSNGASAKIDECVTGGYHLTSLEALAQGLATFAWLDDETRKLLSRMTGSPETSLPWVSTPIDKLEQRLTDMVLSRDALAEAGESGRAWMNRYWTAEAVLAPIGETYDRVAGSATPLIQAAPAAPKPVSVATGRDGALNIYIRGHTPPTRSEDFSQRIRLGPTLLARQDELQGRTAHILGNGPSLAHADIASLADDCVIGVNASVLVREKLGRPLDFYCVSDRRFLATQEGKNLAIAARGAVRVFAGYCEGFLDDTDIHYVRIIPGDLASDDIRRGLHHGCSVALFAGQLAAWLGAGEVRLHGMECDYSAGRFDSSGNKPSRPNDHGIYPRVARSAEALAALLHQRGGRLTVAGPSRLTGGFGSSAISGIIALPIAQADLTLARQPSLKKPNINRLPDSIWPPTPPTHDFAGVAGCSD